MHDDLCPCINKGDKRWCECALIREVRADEREKYEQAWGTGIKAVEYRVTADLRAKVEALRTMDGTEWADGYNDALGAVLDLFGGDESDGAR